MARSEQSKRPAQRPSRLVRGIARVAVPLAVVCGVLGAACVVSLVFDLVTDHRLYEVVKSIFGAGFFVGVALWGIELRRNVLEWDLAIAERQRRTTAE